MEFSSTLNLTKRSSFTLCSQLPEAATNLPKIIARLTEELRQSKADAMKAMAAGASASAVGVNAITSASYVDNGWEALAPRGRPTRGNRRHASGRGRGYRSGRGGQGKSGEEDGEAESKERAKQEEEEQEKEIDWVQCDACSKWRKLPPRSNPNRPLCLPDRCSLSHITHGTDL